MRSRRRSARRAGAARKKGARALAERLAPAPSLFLVARARVPTGSRARSRPPSSGWTKSPARSRSVPSGKRARTTSPFGAPGASTQCAPSKRARSRGPGRRTQNESPPAKRLPACDGQRRPARRAPGGRSPRTRRRACPGPASPRPAARDRWRWVRRETWVARGRWREARVAGLPGGNLGQGMPDPPGGADASVRAAFVLERKAVGSADPTAFANRLARPRRRALTRTGATRSARSAPRRGA